MRRRIGVPLAAALVALAGCGLAGCGGGQDGRRDIDRLADSVGLSGDGALERERRVEQQIRECMLAQGFEYVPVDPFARMEELTGEARPSDEQRAQAIGYGISTPFGRSSPETDANARLRSGLATVDRAAYDRVLWGESIGATFAEAVETEDFGSLGGCTRQASEEAFGGGAVQRALVAGLDEVDEAILRDARMTAALGKWAQCMRERGHAYDDPDEIEGELERRFRSIVGVGVRRGAAAALDPGTSYDRAALAELQRDEVRIATADVECEDRTIAPVEARVRPPLERAFRERNRGLLERVPSLGD